MYGRFMNDWIIFSYIDQQGKCEVDIFLDGLTVNQRAKADAWIDLLEDQGPKLPRPFADTLKDGIHELRIKISGDQIRILYFFAFRNYIILTHQFVKKNDKVPEREILKAKKVRDEFNSRFKTVDQFKKFINELENDC